MTFWDPRTETSVDTSDLNSRQLYGLLYYCAHHAASNFQNHNEPDVVVRLVRIFRARMFKEKALIYGRMRALLNALDPPHCRCGKKGTRMIGSVTFCTKCGPPPHAQYRRDWRSSIREAFGRQHEQEKKDSDLRLLSVKMRPIGKNKLSR